MMQHQDQLRVRDLAQQHFHAEIAGVWSPPGYITGSQHDHLSQRHRLSGSAGFSAQKEGH